LTKYSAKNGVFMSSLHKNRPLISNALHLGFSKIKVGKFLLKLIQSEYSGSAPGFFII